MTAIDELNRQREITLDAINRLRAFAETVGDFSIATQDKAHLRESEVGFHLNRLLLMLGNSMNAPST
jgi:hypothetical protein